MNIYPTEASIDVVTMNWLKVAVTERVSAEVAESLELATWREHLLGSLAYGLSARVLAEQLPPEQIERTGTTSFAVPASWWQMWKEQHPRIWRAGLARRWPVRTVTHERKLTLSVNLQRYRTYPGQKVANPRLGQPVQVATWSDELRWSSDLLP